MKFKLVEVVWRDITTYYGEVIPSIGANLKELLEKKYTYGWIIREKDEVLLLGHKIRKDRKTVYTNIPTSAIEEINKNRSRMEGIEIEGEKTLPVEVVFWDVIKYGKLEIIALEGKRNLTVLSRCKAHAYGIIIKEDDSTMILAYDFGNDECEYFAIPKNNIININKQ